MPAFHAFSEILSLLLPVNGIPQEVLCRIFALVRLGADVVPLLHVCRQWRYIVLRPPLILLVSMKSPCSQVEQKTYPPELWTPFRNRDLTRMLPAFIERSQRAPLDISMCIDSNNIQCLEHLADLQSISLRLRSFNMTISGITMRSPFPSRRTGMLKRPTPTP